MSRVTLVTLTEAIEIIIIANLLLVRSPTASTRRHVLLGICLAMVVSAAIGVGLFYGLEEAEESFEDFEHLFAGFIPVILASLLLWHAYRPHRLGSEITGLLAFVLIMIEGVEIVIGTAGEEAKYLLAGVGVLAVAFTVLPLMFRLLESRLPPAKAQRFAMSLIAFMVAYQLYHSFDEMEEGGYGAWWWLVLAVSLTLMAIWLPRFIRGHINASSRI